MMHKIEVNLTTKEFIALQDITSMLVVIADTFDKEEMGQVMKVIAMEEIEKLMNEAGDDLNKLCMLIRERYQDKADYG
jgi:predicted metal-binding transcription factor (methanogenesis marker protein 9)